MKKLNEMIEEAEALEDNFKISKDILLIRLKDCKEELEKQLTLTDVGCQREQLKRNKTCFMCDKDKPNDGHTCCEDCGGVSF